MRSGQGEKMKRWVNSNAAHKKKEFRRKRSRTAFPFLISFCACIFIIIQPIIILLLRASYGLRFSRIRKKNSYFVLQFQELNILFSSRFLKHFFTILRLSYARGFYRFRKNRIWINLRVSGSPEAVGLLLFYSDSICPWVQDEFSF